MVGEHPKMVSRIKTGTTAEDNPLYVLKVKAIQELLILLSKKYEFRSYSVMQLACFYVFIAHFQLCWVFIAAWAAPPAGVTEAVAGFIAGASLAAGRGLPCLGAREHRLSWGTEAYLPPGTWDLPRPGIEPMSPALAGRFLSTMPPGKALANF